MIDHITLIVKNLQKSTEFYKKTLKPLGYKLLSSESECFDSPTAGFGKTNKHGERDFWLIEKSSQEIKPSFTCLAFKADSKADVDNFYKSALDSGGKDNGKPGYRPKYHPGYYAAFVIDPNGYNIEAVWDNIEKND